MRPGGNNERRREMVEEVVVLAGKSQELDDGGRSILGSESEELKPST